MTLVTTAWLHEHLDDVKLRIVDIRGHVLPATEPLPHYYNHEAAYHESHIPGAVFIDWVHEITDPADPRHAQIAPPERFAEVMRRHGISENSSVVAYDDAGGMFAARLWWSLLYYGHEKAAVLNGGWDKWTAEGRPTTSLIPTVAPGNFEARPTSSIYCCATDVEAACNTNTHIVDVRTPGEYAGQASRAKRAGHIPGALNIPRGVLLNPDGTMLSPGQLRDTFADAGLGDPETPVITYCNGGVSASYGMLALRAAGFTNVAVYDGSWKDWGNDDTKPIETGG